MSPRRGRGRGSTNRSGSNPDFLWVHRTPGSERLSATRQEREELRTITSHARQWRAALRRQQRLYSAQTEATNAQSIVGWGRPGNLSETSSAETSGAPSPAPFLHVTGNSTDPFGYLETPDDAWWSYSAFQFAVQTWLPSIFQNLDVLDERLSPPDSCQAAITRIVQGCLADRMHMFSLLAASSGSAKYVLRLRLDRHDSPEYCMGKALQHLRHHLSGDPQATELLIFDLKALSTFERYVGNFEGARTHLTMVQHLVWSLGGLEALDLPLRMVCRRWDLFIAGKIAGAPLMPLTWDPGRLPPEQFQNSILPDLARSGILPSGSTLLQYEDKVDPGLSTIMGDMVQWFQVQQHNHLNHFAPSLSERWASRRAHALVHRLLSVSSAHPGTNSPHETLRTLLSECIKETFLVLVSDMQLTRATRTEAAFSSDPSTLSWSDDGRLRQALINLTDSEENWEREHEEIVLWMTCLGGQKAEAEAEADEDREWFLYVASDLARRRAIATADNLIQLMSRYLHRCDPTGRPDITGLERILPTHL